MFAGERINVTEDRSVLHVALRMPRGTLARRRRRRRRRGGARGARPDGGVRGRGPLGRLAGLHRAADPQRRQHRDRRLGPRPGDGLPGAPPLQPPRPDLPLRLERRRHGLRRGDARPRSRRDAVRRLLEDLHDARDDDERRDRAAWLLDGLGGDEAAVAPPLRRRLDEPRGGRGVRHRPGERVRLLGLGRRAATRWTRRSGSRRCSRSGPSGSSELLAGFHAMDEHFRTAPLGREPAGADGAARRLVRRLLRRPDRGGAARTTSTSSASPPTCSS